MNKFKVGDKVVRTGLSVGKALQGGVYEISEVFPLISNRLGINLEGHETNGIARFQYYSSGFELYDYNILSPLEAADAILHREPLQEFCEHTGKWVVFACSFKGITLDMLQNTKFRHKPKTVIINGVEVVAPVELPRHTEGYVPSICHREVQTASAGKGRIMWATKEDAQKALDAMLIPFNNLNKEEK